MLHYSIVNSSFNLWYLCMIFVGIPCIPQYFWTIFKFKLSNVDIYRFFYIKWQFFKVEFIEQLLTLHSQPLPMLARYRGRKKEHRFLGSPHPWHGLLHSNGRDFFMTQHQRQKIFIKKKEQHISQIKHEPLNQ